MKQKVGTLTVYMGSMFSGKSGSLIEDIKRFQIAGLKVALVKPEKDNRRGIDKITTHDGREIEAEPIPYVNMIYPIANGVDVVGIDEVQFFDFDIVNVIDELIEDGKTVVVAGLDMDYQGNPFEVTAYLACKADNLEKLRGVCVECGHDGNYSHRTTESAERIVVGGSESYQCLCRECIKGKEIKPVSHFDGGEEFGEY